MWAEWEVVWPAEVVMIARLARRPPEGDPFARPRSGLALPCPRTYSFLDD